ncbi:hypothetical protein FQR65_LT14574 [Abscondita terminalis]|nr:hypothetical protein FQR65_LT14574 [Abscondita terminalis]
MEMTDRNNIALSTIANAARTAVRQERDRGAQIMQATRNNFRPSFELGRMTGSVVKTEATIEQEWERVAMCKAGKTSYFPLNNGSLCLLWKNALRREDFTPTKYSKVCSDHFTSTDYINRPESYKLKLKADAVPSIFPAFPSYLQKSDKKRKRPAIRKVAENKTASIDSPYTSMETSFYMHFALEPEIDMIPSTTSTNLRVCETRKKLQSSPTKDILRKKIKTLRQKIRRKNTRIRSLKNCITVLKRKGLLQTDSAELLKHNFEGVSLELFCNELKNQKRVPTGRRYSEEIKKFALTLNYYSPKGYNFVRSVLNLPHPSAIRNWTSSVNADPGFFKEVFEALVGLPAEDKQCNLVLDSMSIRKQIVWDSNAYKFVGYCNFGNNLQIEEHEIPATEALVFMLVALNGKWKWPIGYFLEHNTNATAQAELIKTALILADNIDIRVWGVTCDGTIKNFTTLNRLDHDPIQKKRDVFLLRRANADFYPAAAECADLQLHGLGKKSVEFKLTWSIARLQRHVCEAYNAVDLEAVGFRFAKCNKEKKLQMFSPNTLEELINLIPRGTIVILPNRDVVIDYSTTTMINVSSQRNNNELAETYFSADNELDNFLPQPRTNGRRNLQRALSLRQPDNVIGNSSTTDENLEEDVHNELYLNRDRNGSEFFPEQADSDNDNFNNILEVENTYGNVNDIALFDDIEFPSLPENVEDVISLEVKRENVLEEFLDLYKDETLELFTEFWKQCLGDFFRGEGRSVPYLPLSKIRKGWDAKFLIIGRILAHNIILTDSIPIQLCKSIYLKLGSLDSEIPSAILLEDFHHFLTASEQHLLIKAKTSFDKMNELELSLLQDLFSTYGLFKNPKQS